MAVKNSTLAQIRLENFAGGWNIRDAPSELQPNESPDAWNVTGDEHGGIQKVLGRSKYNGSVFPGGAPPQNVYNWNSGNHKITQVGTSLFLDTSTTAFKTFSTSARCGFADFTGKLWFIHPVDGVFSSDGTSVGTSAIAGSPKGSALVAWQNRLLALGDPANPSRLYVSKLGDGTNWTGPGSPTASDPWTNDIRVLDDTILTAFEPASGMDIQGRGGLVVCKKNSMYRVYDSSSGAFTVLSPVLGGAASSLAMVNIYDRVLSITTTGIYEYTIGTWGINPPTLVSQKLQPLFQSSQLNWSRPDLFCAGVYGDRVRFSVPLAGSNANNMAIEYHPLLGWFFPSSLAASCYATDPVTGFMYGGSPTVNGQVYQHDSTGADDGAAITSWFQTKWLEPNSGMLDQLVRLRMNGRGTGTIVPRTDYSAIDGTGSTFTLMDTTPLYDSGNNYDSGLNYGPQGFQQTQDFWGLGTCKSVSFRIEETSTSTLTGPQIADQGSGATVGAWALYGLDLLHTPLGIA